MRKESLFSMNRILLIAIVVSSTTIPLIYLPKVIQSPVQHELLSVLTPIIPEVGPISGVSHVIDKSRIEISLPEKENKGMVISTQQLLQYTYILGLCFSFLILFHGLFSILMLFRKAKFLKMDGFWLLVIDRDISAFSFGRYIILSQADYEEHSVTMLAHEQAHIRLNHFYDLLLFEIVKIFHWFNPLIYRIVKDLKEIHEFQADNYTLTKGIDATQYQLLIIKKCVGSQRFALANSFNHCQIKKRIAMMNKQKTRKAWKWKVATFLPMLALLLMAFGKSGENPPETKMTANLIIQKQQEIQPVKEGITNDQLIEYMVSDQTKIDTKGQVLKSNGQPMSGASVQLNGSTLGTMTDQEGKFELKGVPSDAGSKQENFPLNDRKSPCDAKLTDRTIANAGKDATYIQGMMATEKGDRLEGSSFSMTLNEGVVYRFTTGSSELSQVDVIVNLYYGFDKKLIKQQKVEPGKYGNFEYSCENTGKYAIRLSYKEKGKSCVQILLSKVGRE